MVATKIGKLYAGRASLLVYLNIGEFGVRQAEIEAAMAPAITPALPCFQRVWILWKARLYGPWAAEDPDNQHITAYGIRHFLPLQRPAVQRSHIRPHPTHELTEQERNRARDQAWQLPVRDHGASGWLSGAAATKAGCASESPATRRIRGKRSSGTLNRCAEKSCGTR